MLVGAVTLSGSVAAFAKLQELLPGRPLTFPAQRALSALLFAAIVALGAWLVATRPADAPPWALGAVAALALALGVLLVLPIGGADMPVVISLLNSYSGIAAAMTGFVIDNHVLIIAGALVGSSGIILSQIMCRAMNRSLASVLFGAFGGSAASAARSAEGLAVRPISPEDAALQLGYARAVVVVPGYGMAVAQAQHHVRELAEVIERRGGEVRYAIHPVAGRMPGHMNVLLSEAQVPYDRLVNEVDDANALLARADVALVVGANDIVNPAAVEDPTSPLYGMPVIQPWRARQVIVLKRSLAAGFAGVENPLFYRDNIAMLFGDAKQSLGTLIAEMGSL
jgi:NAD(P) transhydrogenase subunit beta